MGTPVSSWSTPMLDTVRGNNKAYIEGRLRQPLIPNDYPRVLADANAGNAHLNLQYLDWQANQLLPDTAQQHFLERWGTIYLVNADGSRGRKPATYAAARSRSPLPSPTRSCRLDRCCAASPTARR